MREARQAVGAPSGAAGEISGSQDSGRSLRVPAQKTRSAEWTILELLRWTTQYFEGEGIASARLDAECLLADALGCDRLRLYVDYDKSPVVEERERFREQVRRRAQERIPVAYLLGTREFWSLPLAVSPDVLVPRPETETLVSAALEFLGDSAQVYRVLDIGTGSGCVALAIASACPNVQVTATDLSPAALRIAKRNADALGLADRVRFLTGDLFEPVVSERFDLIVSNPPYVARREAEGLPPELEHEPELALFGGEDGLQVIDRLIDAAGDYLEPGGAVCIEIDPRQAAVTVARLQESGFRDVGCRRDLARDLRVVVGLHGSARTTGER